MIKKNFSVFLCFVLCACSLLNNSQKFNLDKSEQLVWLNTERALNNQDLKNKFTVVYFWHFADESQFQTLEMLKICANRFPDELLIIGVNMPLYKYEKDATILRNFLMKYAVEFPVVHDDQFQIANSNSVFANPLILIVDPSNQIIQEFDEMPSRDSFMALIRAKIQKFSKRKKLDLQVKSLIFTEKEKLKIERRNEYSQITSSVQNGQTIIQEQSSKKFNLFFPSGLAWNNELELLGLSDTANHQIKVLDKYSKLIKIIG